MDVTTRHQDCGGQYEWSLRFLLTTNGEKINAWIILPCLWITSVVYYEDSIIDVYVKNQSVLLQAVRWRFKISDVKRMGVYIKANTKQIYTDTNKFDFSIFRDR